MPPYCAWRKNRQPNAGTSAIGTDLNRNYDYHWGCCGGSSGSPSSITYRGRTPFSAPGDAGPPGLRPQPRRRRDPADQGPHHVPHERPADPLAVRLHEDRHPGRHDRRRPPARSSRWARRWPRANGYKAEQSSDLYITDGDQIDWMYGRQRIFSFTWELYPARDGDRLGRPLPGRREHRPADGPQPERPALPHRRRRLPVPSDRPDDSELRPVLRRHGDLPRLAGQPRRHRHGDQRRRFARGDPGADDRRAAIRIQPDTTPLRAAWRSSPVRPAGANANAYDLDGATTIRSVPITLPATPGALTFRYVFAHGPSSRPPTRSRSRSRTSGDANAGLVRKLGSTSTVERRLGARRACR